MHDKVSVVFCFIFHSILTIVGVNRHPQLRSYISCGDGKVPHWVLSHLDRHELVASVVHSTQVNTTEDFAFAWQTAFHTALNRASFPSLGPLWRYFLYVPIKPVCVLYILNFIVFMQS